MKDKDHFLLKNISIQNLDLKYGLLLEKETGINPYLCWHCLTCSGGCPFTEVMDYYPNQIIRMVQLGLIDEVLRSTTIWVCVGCNTCAVQCPQAIDIPAIMDHLRQKALKEKTVVAEPDILNFHKEVLNSIKRYGRAHKLEIMMRFKLKKRNFLEDASLGVKMFLKRKLELMPTKVTKIEDIQKLF